MKTVISFSRDKDWEFKKTLKARVDDYFNKHNLSKNGNAQMVLKTIILLGLYFFLYGLIISGNFNVWIMLLMSAGMGFMASGVGMSVMHDANHGSYSKKSWMNNLIGTTLNLIGGDSYNWKIKHNKLHHVYTNIYNRDEDIASRALLRFSFSAPLKRYHRFQYLYAYPFYALMSLSILVGDIPKRIRYRKSGITNQPRKRFISSFFSLVAWKLFYIGYLGVIPILLLEITWWQWLIGFLTMHMITGFVLAMIFQMAHVVEGPEQPEPNGAGKISDSMIVHQLKTSADFSKGNRALSWFVGGLNFQVEHHLFPRICHIHYPKLALIVEKTTKEFNIPYHVYPSFWNAMRSHIRTLRLLGNIKH
jgi:linoleoyl-CoA desaturase